MQISEHQVMIRPIAYIRTDFHERFGIPRQAGLAEALTARVILEPEFRCADALKGMEGFSYLWLIWGFSKTRVNMEEAPAKWSALIAPPRLGGKVKAGVFATRSPYRPNSLGLSSVELIRVVREGADAPFLIVGGADLLDRTPIYDIKPYIPYTDSHPDASEGFAVSEKTTLCVDFPEDLLKIIAAEKQTALLEVLAQDPRGSYEKQPGYVYGLRFANYDIRFIIENDDHTLRVFEVKTIDPETQAVFTKIK